MNRYFRIRSISGWEFGRKTTNQSHNESSKLINKIFLKCVSSKKWQKLFPKIWIFAHPREWHLRGALISWWYQGVLRDSIWQWTGAINITPYSHSIPYEICLFGLLLLLGTSNCITSRQTNAKTVHWQNDTPSLEPLNTHFRAFTLIQALRRHSIAPYILYKQQVWETSIEWTYSTLHIDTVYACALGFAQGLN